MVCPGRYLSIVIGNVNRTAVSCKECLQSACTLMRFGVQFHPEKNAFEHGEDLSQTMPDQNSTQLPVMALSL